MARKMRQALGQGKLSQRVLDDRLPWVRLAAAQSDIRFIELGNKE